MLSRHSREVLTTSYLQGMTPSFAQLTKSVESDQVIATLARVKRSINDSMFELFSNKIKIVSYYIEITKLWNGLNFLCCDHTHFLLLTHPHSSVLLSVVSTHSQLNWPDQVWQISLNHSMANNYRWINLYLSTAIE